MATIACSSNAALKSPISLSEAFSCCSVRVFMVRGSSNNKAAGAFKKQASCRRGPTRAVRSYLPRLEQRPIKVQLRGCLDQAMNIYRLENKSFGAQTAALGQLVTISRGGQHHDRNRARSFAGFDSPEHLDSIERGQFQIQKHQLRPLLHRAL